MTAPATTTAGPTAPATPGGTIDVRGVGMRFTSADGTVTEALAATDLHVEPGQFVSVLGPSGCGKSTLLRIVAGLVTPTDGTAEIDGEPVRGPSRRIGIAFQQSVLLPWYTVRRNVELPGVLRRERPRAEVARRAEELLAAVRLAASGDRYPHELSGGMRQRVAIARALVTDPAIVLMDEPFGALDALTREHLNDELLAIRRASGATVLFVTHDIAEAVYLSDRVIVMSARPGRVVADIDVALPRPRGAATREDPRAAELATRMRRLIDDQDGSAR